VNTGTVAVLASRVAASGVTARPTVG